MKSKKTLIQFLFILTLVSGGQVSLAATYQAVEETVVQPPVLPPVLPPVTTYYTLTASKAGTGAGVINGIESASTVLPQGSTLTLTATANSGSIFTGWSGDCSGTGSCSITLNSNKSITANFNVVTAISPETTITQLYYFSKDLKLGIRHPQVTKLQQYLNSKGYIIATQGAGSPGFETSYFGPSTKSALILFQLKNRITPAEGFFGKVTRTLINAGLGI